MQQNSVKRDKTSEKLCPDIDCFRPNVQCPFIFLFDSFKLFSHATTSAGFCWKTNDTFLQHFDLALKGGSQGCQLGIIDARSGIFWDTLATRYWRLASSYLFSII